MTDNDKHLIDLANATPYTEWASIDKLKEQCDTVEAYDMLHRIQGRKYHDEEWSAGLL